MGVGSHIHKALWKERLILDLYGAWTVVELMYTFDFFNFVLVETGLPDLFCCFLTWK